MEFLPKSYTTYIYTTSTEFNIVLNVLKDIYTHTIYNVEFNIKNKKKKKFIPKAP